MSIALLISDHEHIFQVCAGRNLEHFRHCNTFSPLHKRTIVSWIIEGQSSHLTVAALKTASRRT